MTEKAENERFEVDCEKEDGTDMRYQEHTTQWTDESVARFWDAHSRNPHSIRRYFSNLVGDGLIRFLRKHIELRGRICDYGAGGGHLIRHLLDIPEMEISAVEFSATSAAAINEAYSDRPNYRGCRLVLQGRADYPDAAFDTLFLIETIEHLSESHLKATLTEANRLLRPGGLLIVTTPNNEVLDDNTVHCPDCGAIFHRWQHMRSFDIDTLGGLLGTHAFNQRLCIGVNLWDFKPPSRRWLRRFRLWVARLAEPPPAVNLVYIGAKSVEKPRPDHLADCSNS